MLLWCWHWLRDISLPVHFTPLMAIAVTLLLSQYQVSFVFRVHTVGNNDSAWRRSRENQMAVTHS